MPETRPDLRRRSRRRPLPRSHEARSWIAPSPGEYPLGEAKRLRQLRRALGRRQRRAHRLGAELLEREQQAADDRERLAVLLADPFGVVPVVYEEVERMPVSGQPCRAQDDRASPADKLTQLVRQRGELAQLDHVIGRHLGVAEALRGTRRHSVRRGRDLILAEIEAREHDRLTIYVARDVDVLALHGFTTVSADSGHLVMALTYPDGSILRPASQGVS